MKPVSTITTIHLAAVECVKFHVDHGGKTLSGPSVISWRFAPQGTDAPSYLTGTRAELEAFGTACIKAARAGAHTNGVRPPTNDGYAVLKGDHDA